MSKLANPPKIIVKKGRNREQYVDESCFKNSAFWGTCSLALQFLKYENLRKLSKWFSNFDPI